MLGCAIAISAVLAASAQAAGGTWERAWGKDVVTGGGTGFEICTVAGGCKAGSTSTALGGELSFPNGIGTDAAGNIYVADSSHNRIQKFDSAGNFLRAWGKDVIQSGAPGDTGTGFEICTAAANCKTGSSGTLGGDLGFPEDVATDAAGNVYVSEGSNSRVQKFGSAGNFLRAWGKDVIQSAAPGDTGTGFEICTVAANCKAGTGGGLGGELNSPVGVATDTAGNLYVADGGGNLRIQKFDSAGNFLRTWGKDVIQFGATGDTGGGFEICTVAADCQMGSIGSLGGELQFADDVATDALGGVYVTDTSNDRIQKFGSAGNFLRAWGKDVIQSAAPGDTGTGFEICTVAANCKAGSTATELGGELDAPAGVATDAADTIYVTDTSNERIQKFDSSGNFLRAWGKDVIQSGAPGDTGTGFEICTAAANCKTGSSGALGGELNDPMNVATDGTGGLYVADASNNRIQKFADPPGPPPGPVGGNPSNAFTIGKLSGKKLTLTVASVGTVDVTDAHANARRASASARALLLKHSHASGGPGTITVTLKLTKYAKRRLRHTGKVKVKAKITFTPSGGFAASQNMRLKITK